MSPAYLDSGLSGAILFRRSRSQAIRALIRKKGSLMRRETLARSRLNHVESSRVNGLNPNAAVSSPISRSNSFPSLIRNCRCLISSRDRRGHGWGAIVEGSSRRKEAEWKVNRSGRPRYLGGYSNRITSTGRSRWRGPRRRACAARNRRSSRPVRSPRSRTHRRAPCGGRWHG